MEKPSRRVWDERGAGGEHEAGESLEHEWDPPGEGRRKGDGSVTREVSYDDTNGCKGLEHACRLAADSKDR